jgi:hopanoid biosynthesis associated protein HpnK
MKYLIVNADDFGLTAGVNRAVIEGHTRGLITSATIMANMPSFDEAVRLAKENPTLGVGLHFNITQGRPVADAPNLSALVNDQGEFFGSTEVLAKKLLIGKLRIVEVIVELRAQIERVFDAGLRLTHIDSHKHSHALPQICAAIVETIKDYGIEAVRLPRERWFFNGQSRSLKLFSQGLGALVMAQLCRVNAAKLRQADVKTTDAFFGVTQTGFWSRQWLLELIDRLPEGVSELMCHPGYDDDQLKTVETRLRESRAVEFRLLTDPEIIDALRRRGVELINYSRL